jgi:alpha-L-arabinofuranosidase
MRKSFLFFSLFIAVQCSQAQRSLLVEADKISTPVPTAMWGVFFEDINFAADGGLYAELIKNRSFEFPMPLMGWRENRVNYQKGRILVINRTGNEGNPRFARITIHQPDGNYSLSNEGYRGIGIHKDARYEFSIIARQEEGQGMKLRIQLLNHAGKEIGTTSISGFTSEWKNYSVTINSSDSAQRGKLNIVVEGTGVLDIDMVSLFPQDTWKQRPGGLRKDLVQKIADLQPGFIRFPGGCIVEGRDLTNRYQWKTTVGRAEERKLIMNRWNVEFPRKSAPDYFQSFGLGFFEYFQLAEDLGAEPLPILNCGMACQFNSGEVVAMDELQPYINDALDLIEFANGPVTSRWGKLRSEMGHPAPFHMKLLGVGNEQWEPQYIERYRVFEKAILDQYPDIKIVSGSGPYAEGEYFNYAWKELKNSKASFVDEHYYKPPSWFLSNAARYDKYERNGPKIFAGEYAAHVKGNPTDGEGMNCWESALAEAAFMTGLERNADIVQMCSYAPLLAHTDAWQWRPDLIWFDNLNSMATPNYYVQQMFSVNKGTDVVKISEAGQPIAGKDSLYASAVINRRNNELIIKLVNAGSTAQITAIDLKGIQVTKKPGTVQVLASSNPAEFNKLSALEKLKPVTGPFNLKSKTIQYEVPGNSVSVLTIPYKN